MSGPTAGERPEGSAALDDARRRMRLKLAVAAGALAVALSLGALIWLFSGGDSDPSAPPDLSSLDYVDGTLTVVEDRRLVMRPFRPLEGRDEIAFSIREGDARYFDTAHLQSHSSIGLPTRIYYEREGDRYFARYKEDAPANSSRGS